jgi:hypothetical protein
MAGGGTGGILGPRNPTDPIKITPGATPGVNPIGGVKGWKDTFTGSSDNTGFIWSGNLGENVPVYFLADKNGNIIPETDANAIETAGLSAGSPITVMSAINKIINEKMAVPGEIAKLKQNFIDKEFLVGVYAKKSMANPDLPDAYFRQALADALYLQSLSNIKLAQEGAKKFMNFDDFILNVGKQGDPNAPTGGSSVDGTRKSITYQKFAAEDYDIAVDQLFQQTVGRGASDEELKDFIAKLQAYGDKNPQKEINKVSNNGKTQIATQSGGVTQDAAMAMARNQALATPEAENYNKATKYLEYFREALDSPIQLGQ